MRLAIVGAGNVGGALGRGWAHAGHEVVYGVRDPKSPKHAQAARGAGGALLTTVAEAVKHTDAIVLAVQWSAVKAAIEACGDLTGRVLIDVTNPLLVTDSGMELAIGFTTSAGEQVQALAPGARVVKTLNQVGSDVMADASGYAVRPVMFIAGDDDAAKQLAGGLVRDLGFDPEDGGPLKTARLLEPMAMLWIDQVYRRGAARDCAFALLRRSIQGRQ